MSVLEYNTVRVQKGQNVCAARKLICSGYAIDQPHKKPCDKTKQVTRASAELLLRSTHAQYI